MIDSPLDACWDRLERTDEHRSALATIWNQYLDDEPFDVSLIHEGEGVHILRVWQTTPIPAGFALEFGEWLYNLRACHREAPDRPPVPPAGDMTHFLRLLTRCTFAASAGGASSIHFGGRKPVPERGLASFRPRVLASFRELWQAFASFRPRALASFGKLSRALASFRELWQALASFGRELSRALASFRELSAAACDLFLLIEAQLGHHNYRVGPIVEELSLDD